MRKLVLSALLLASAFQTALGAVEGQWTYIIENGGATITASTATGAVTIPSVLGGYNVKKVGNNGPAIFGPPNGNNTTVTSVTIPNSVTSIGGGAFTACSGLTTLTIGSGVTSIGGYAFWACLGLASVTIPNTVTSIGDSAFQSCNGLTTLTIGSGVTSIGDYAFANCPVLTGTLTIPNSVTSIGDSAFASASMLQRVFLPVRFGTTYQNFGLTASQVILYDPSNLDPAPMYLAGQQSVIANPNTHDLYTANQMQAMAMGDLVLTKNSNGSFTLNYDIEQSVDMVTWTPYQALFTRLDGLPPDKAFVRIQIKTSMLPIPPVVTDPNNPPATPN